MSDPDSDNGGTVDIKYRWKYTATLTSIILILSLVALLIGAGVGLISLAAIPQAWFIAYSLLISAAGTWLYGVELLDHVRR